MIKDTRSRICISLLIVVLLFVSCSPTSYAQQPTSSDSDSKFRFVVLPDMHFKAEESDNALAVRRAAVNKVINEIKPAFVIQTGDIIDLESGTQANQEFIAKSWGSAEREVLSKLSEAKIDIIYSPGNHDGAEGSDFRSPASIPAYNEVWSRYKPKNIQITGEFGQYYSFDYKNSHFVALYAPGASLKNAASQNVWLKDDLERSRQSSANIFVFGHPPLYSPKLIDCEDRSDKKFLQNDGTFINTLLTYQVNLYIGGHIHVYVEQKTGGVNEMIGGMLSGGRRTLASAGRTQPFTFTVVDVEGDKIDARPIEFKSELGDFDTSALPPAPAVDTPLSAPESIEQLAAAAVCPAGTHPAAAGVGAVAGMTSPSGIALPTEVGSLEANTILVTARAKEGTPYGAATGAYTDTSFIIQVLGELGIPLSADAQSSLLGVGGASAEKFASALSGVSQPVVLASAQPGDIVYYSWQEAGVTKDDAGIIESVKGDGKFNIYGAHESLSKVSSLTDVSLASPVSSVIVRLNPSASASQTPQSVVASPEVPASPAAPSTSADAPQASAAAITGCGTRIAAVGDSITQGPSYVKYLRTMCGDMSIQNDDGDANTLGQKPASMPGSQWGGANGAWKTQGDKFAFVGKNTGQMLVHFDAVLATGPETVMILGGTNDVLGSWQNSKANLEKMYNAAKEKGMRVVALTLPPYDTAAARAEEERSNRKSPGTIVDNIKQLNNWIMTQSPADIKVNIYDALLNPAEADSANPALYAGAHLIHPNEEGKRLMAQKVFEALSGTSVPSVPTSTTAPAAAEQASSIPVPTSPVTCIPDSALSQILYDFIINSTFGSTTIVGIARQNIAVGIKKESELVQDNAVCIPIISNTDYSMDFLKSTYGRFQQDIESQLVPVQFMGKPVKVHRLIQPVLGCVEQSINTCEEGKAYDFASVGSYEWIGVDNNDDLFATSSFGVSLNINLDRNPNSQDGELRTDIPQCVIDAFKRFGFRWGGEFGTVKMPSLFVFSAQPSQVAIQQDISCPEGTSMVEENGAGVCKPVSIGPLSVENLQCNMDIPNLETESVNSPSCDGKIINGYAFPHDTEYTRDVKQPTNGRNYGTIELAKAIMAAGCVVKSKYGVKLEFGDLSQQGGGEVNGHESHESGRDVDIYFVQKTNAGYTQPGAWSAVQNTEAEQVVDHAFDLPANYDLIKSFVKTTPTEYIFLHTSIKRALKQYAQQNFPGEWEQLGFEHIIHYAKNHHHHYHIRIACPAGDNRCSDVRCEVD